MDEANTKRKKYGLGWHYKRQEMREEIYQTRREDMDEQDKKQEGRDIKE